MTMTGRTLPEHLRPEYEPDNGRVVWGHEIGAIDASNMIPAGSTVPCFKGHLGFGVPRSARRESWTTTNEAME